MSTLALTRNISVQHIGARILCSTYCCAHSGSSSSSSRGGSSCDRSRRKCVALIISIVHTQFLFTADDVIEWRMVAMLYVSALKSILVANSSLSSICFVEWTGATSAVLIGRLVQVHPTGKQWEVYVGIVARRSLVEVVVF